MSKVMRVLVATAGLAICLPAPTRRVLDAQTSSALPQTFLALWSWRSVGPDTTTFSNVVTDTTFPYRICGTATTRRAACVPSRVDARESPATDWIDFRSATPIAIDPTDPD